MPAGLPEPPVSFPAPVEPEQRERADTAPGTVGRCHRRSTVTVSAPSRLDFTGGFTDVTPFCNLYGSVQVNAGLGLRTTVRATSHSGTYVRVRSGAAGKCWQWDLAETSVPADGSRLVWFIVNGAAPNVGLEIDIEAEVPLGAGLASSGSLSVALTEALLRLKGCNTSPATTAELAVEFERRAGIRGGRQDQYAAAHGGVNMFLFGDNPAVATVPLAERAEMNWLEDRLLIAHAPGQRESSDLVGAILGAYEDGAPTVTAALLNLNRLGLHLAEAVRGTNLPALMSHIDAVRAAQRDLHPSIIDPRFDHVLDAIDQSRVAAAKVIGGGGPGGCLLLAFEPRNRATVERAFTGTGIDLIEVRLADQGIVPLPQNLGVTHGYATGD